MGSGNTQRGEKRLTQKLIEEWLRSRDRKPGQKLADGGALYLTSLPSGGATWQARYSGGVGKAAKVYSIGPVERIDVHRARNARDEMQRQLRDGVDPLVERRLARIRRDEANVVTFKTAAAEWLAKQQPTWSEVHYKKSARALERDVYPKLGAVPVDLIETRDVSAVIDAIQKRGGGRRETAQKVLQHVRSVFMFAEAKGWVSKNPAVPVVQILDAAPPVQHHPALLTFPELGDVLRRAEISNLSSAVRLAHRLIAFTCVRISNATAARWDQFDLDAAVPTWTIDREEMKVKTSESRTHAHRVVLPAQIRADLDRWREVQPKDAQYVFPGNQGRDHLTREAIEKALRVTLELDGKHSPHGWRAAFSTRAREDTDFAKELIDLTLDHVHASETALAYDRGQRLEKRIELMKWWGDALSQAERGCVVVPLRSVA